eukprot:765785-Hanusia_phi.AAC.2
MTRGISRFLIEEKERRERNSRKLPARYMERDGSIREGLDEGWIFCVRNPEKRPRTPRRVMEVDKHEGLVERKRERKRRWGGGDGVGGGGGWG